MLLSISIFRLKYNAYEICEICWFVTFINNCIFAV